MRGKSEGKTVREMRGKKKNEGNEGKVRGMREKR